MPVPDPTVAIPVLLLLQVPPASASLSVIWEPAVTVLLPEIVAGAGLTVKIIVVILVPTVYDMVHVPAETPVTIPVEEPTAAIPELLLLQWPPEVESIKVTVEPAQTLAVPLIPPSAVTVTI
jgi:hypothetical protein